MKKPWQIWTAFAVCLSAVILAMLWLSFKTIEMDRARETDRRDTEVARQQAELQERISSALYRMDLKLLPLVSREASRPHYLYEPFYEISNPTLLPSTSRRGDALEKGVLGKTKGLDSAVQTYPKVPSPLLIETPEFVLLHFQLRADNTIASPQHPQGSARSRAKEIAGKQFEAQSANRLETARQFCCYDALLERSSDCQAEFTKGPLADPIQADGNFYNSPANMKINLNLAKNPKSDYLPQGKVAIQQMRSEMRVNDEFNRRLLLGNQMQMQQQKLQQHQVPEIDPSDLGFVEQGVMQPIWIEDKLILFRRINGEGEPFFQCCWLDWNGIKEDLRTEVADLLPEVAFEPVKTDTDLNVGTALTTLPIQLIVDSQKLLSTLSLNDNTSTIKDRSGLKMSLLLSWLGVGIAAVASAFLLNGVMKLSERRASFVSAVTHELRTPLTTFRMYSEMLAERMVPEEKQRQYANTLKLEADRLSHLVENVLQFARLERSSAKPTSQTVAVNELLERCSPRLIERVNESDMKLSINIDDTVCDTSIQTHPASVEQIIFNLVDNACKYAKPNSKNLIELKCSHASNALRISVRDYGPGVAPKFKKTMFQPFSKSDIDAANTAPGVGLGLALCRRMARSQGGRLFHESQTDGALFVLELPL